MGIKIKEIKKNLPIKTDRLVIDLIKQSDVDWYCDEIMKDYYLKYLDCREKMKTSKTEAKLKVSSMALAYSLGCMVDQLRFIAKDKETGEVYGGISVYEVDKPSDMLTFGYWIDPDYQGLGYATEMVNAMYDFIAVNIPESKGIQLEIQIVNSRSVKLAERCHFAFVERKNGRYCTNVIYRRYFCRMGDEYENQAYSF